jgi:nucleoside-diphosphate-sugar epimerase
MRVLVTGATGKVGNAVARALAARGDEVRALVRQPEKARAVLPETIELVRGDVTDPASIETAVAGCELAFTAHGLPEQWVEDPAIFDRVNARGAEAVALAARAAGVRRLVHTSTIDVFHAEPGGRFDESRVADYPKGTAYERSKQRAEQLVLATRAGGFEVVVVNPCAVYGPGPAASASIDGDFIKPIVAGKLPALPPGGFGVVYVDGVASGHLLAAERGEDGERYILSDRHVSLRGLAEAVVRTAHRGRVPPTLPRSVAQALSALGEPVARRLGKPPLLPRGQLLFFLWDAAPDSGKAQDELGWRPTLLDDGLAAAVAAL